MSEMTFAEKNQIFTAGQVCFEEALGKLEVIVDQLESGELSLEAALAKFEEGVALSRFCVQRLAEVEAKIDILLTEEQGQPVSSPLSLKGDAEC